MVVNNQKIDWDNPSPGCLAKLKDALVASAVEQLDRESIAETGHRFSLMRPHPSFVKRCKEAENEEDNS